MSSDPIQQGYMAYINGECEDSNPYNVNLDSDRYFDWLDGYADARADTARRVKRSLKMEELKLKARNRLINILISMVFVAACFIIGTLLRYLIG